MEKKKTLKQIMRQRLIRSKYQNNSNGADYMNKIDMNKIESQLINNSKKVNFNKNNAKKSFNEVLDSIEKKNSEIKFSKHATKRLNNRNIDVSKEDIKKLEDAFSKAEKSGVKDALILIDNKAFIANINSKTIVTTVERGSLKQNVFTNIDGAVIIQLDLK